MSKLGWFSSYPGSLPSLSGAIASLAVAFGLAGWSEDAVAMTCNVCYT